jgi:hypothetical protein
MTLAQKYNAKALEVMPGMIDDLRVDEALDSYGDIEEEVNRNHSELILGMAFVILALVK